MAIRPYDHIDVVLSGGWSTQSGTWSCTLTCARTDLTPMPGTLTPADMASAATDISASFTSTMSSARQSFGSDCTCLFVRTYLRLANQSGAAFVGEAPVSASTAGTPAQAYQIALVATLLTGAAGRAFRGRLYWPLGLGGRQVASTVSGSYATGTANYIAGVQTAISAIAGGAAGPVIGTHGALVRSVRVDSVPDTQRRRRDKVTSSATSSADVPVG